MLVSALATKAHGAVDALALITGTGLAGDRHADPLGPRHVLLASGPVLAAHRLAPGAIGDNLIVDEAIDALPSGALLAIGDAVLRVTFRCESCHHLDRVRPGLAAALRGQRGVLARVVAGGTIAVGDRIAVGARRLRAIPDQPRDRLADLLAIMPAGQVVTYRQLRTTLGYPTAYLRAVPAWLKRLGAAERVVKVADAARSWDSRAYFADEQPR